MKKPVVKKRRVSGASGERVGWGRVWGFGSLGAAVALWITLAAPGAPASERSNVEGGGSPRVPVIFVPGVTGVELRELESGKILWGKGVNLIFPRDHGYGIARAIEAGPSRSRVGAGSVIRRLRLAGVVRKAVYQPLVDLLEERGYRVGDLADPQPGDTLFLYGYDWRQSNVDSAHQLLE